ncbi:MAG: NnrS family protein [Leptospira sp.]|nr:NnrS family protein [Leptospira sp.]
MNKIKIFNFADPYRFFFPLGIIGSILGTGIWVFGWVVQKKWITGFNTDTYPVEVHVGLIGGLFLLPVIKGFILTAIPRFTGTSLTGPVEIIPFQILQIMIAGLLLFFQNENIVHYFLFRLNFSALIWISKANFPEV